MKKKICFIIALTLLLTPSIGLAEDINVTTSPNIALTRFELSWSTDTYAPIEYIGRTLPTTGSKIFIDASVRVANGDAKSLKYSWFLDDIFQKNKSGYGKDSFYFYAKSISGRSHIVRVQVFNEDRTIFQEKTIEIPIVSPEIILNRRNINNLSIVAKPYFFSIDKLTDLKFEWTIQGQSPITSSGYSASILDISITNKDSDKLIEQELIVNVKNLKDAAQNARKSIRINI